MENTATTAVNNQPETANQLLRQVRKYNRRKFAADDKIRIILEGLKREVSVSELCRLERISPHIYYVWLKDFMEAGKARLQGDSKRQANSGEVEALRIENGQLKMLVAEKTLENALFKKSLAGSENYGTSK